MFRRWMSVTTVTALLVAGATFGQARASLFVGARGSGTVVSVSYFYDALSPYGRWIEMPPYGWCWSPAYVDADWRPYSDGYWVYTDFGWTWVDYEPWGWAPFHYGRWLEDRQYGWVWVPGTEWAPAWVAWRYTDDCVGWAALTPADGWGAWGGRSFGDVGRIPERRWCFVNQRALVDRNLRREFLPVERNAGLVARSRAVARFGDHDGRPVNTGINVAAFERQTRREVPRMRVFDAPRPSAARPTRDGAIELFRPRVNRAQQGARPPQRAEARPQEPSAAMRPRWPRSWSLTQSLQASQENRHRTGRELRSIQPGGAPPSETPPRARKSQAFAPSGPPEPRGYPAFRMTPQAPRRDRPRRDAHEWQPPRGQGAQVQRKDHRDHPRDHDGEG